MLRALQSFLKNPQPTESEAASVVRFVYMLMFVAQILVAAVLAGVVSALMGQPVGQQSSGNLLAQILIVMSLVQLPFALFLSIGMSKAGGKQAALSASIMAGVLLSTPAWFIALTFLVSSTSVYLAILFGILMLYYAIGLVLCGRWAKVALQEKSGQVRDIR